MRRLLSDSLGAGRQRPQRREVSSASSSMPAKGKSHDWGDALSRYADVEMAKKEVMKWGGFRWKCCSRCNVTGALIYSCATHVECAKRMRITPEDSTVTVREAGAHGTVCAPEGMRARAPEHGPVDESGNPASGVETVKLRVPGAPRGLHAAFKEALEGRAEGMGVNGFKVKAPGFNFDTKN